MLRIGTSHPLGSAVYRCDAVLWARLLVEVAVGRAPLGLSGATRGHVRQSGAGKMSTGKPWSPKTRFHVQRDGYLAHLSHYLAVGGSTVDPPSYEPVSTDRSWAQSPPPPPPPWPPAGESWGGTDTALLMQYNPPPPHPHGKLDPHRFGDRPCLFLVGGLISGPPLSLLIGLLFSCFPCAAAWTLAPGLAPSWLCCVPV